MMVGSGEGEGVTIAVVDDGRQWGGGGGDYSCG